MVLYCRAHPSQPCCPKYAIFSNHLQLLPFQTSQIVNGERTLRTEELSRDVQGLTSHNDDLLTIEQLLSHSRGQTTKEVALAIDRDLFRHHNQHSSSRYPQSWAQEKLLHLLTGSQVCSAVRETYDWLEGRHVCPNSRGVTRQFVEMVAGILYLREWWRSGSRFVVEILGVSRAGPA